MTTYTMSRTVEYTVRTVDTMGTTSTSDDVTTDTVMTRIETYEVTLPDPPPDLVIDPGETIPAGARLVNAVDFEDADGDQQLDTGEAVSPTPLVGTVTDGDVIIQNAPAPALSSAAQVTGGTVAQLQAQLQFIWDNGGAEGRQFVTDFVARMNSGQARVEYSSSLGVPMQVEGSTFRMSSTADPATLSRADQVRFMVSFRHEMNHLLYDGAYNGTAYGELRAYLAGYDYATSPNGLGLTDAQFRAQVGTGDPTYLIGTMVRVYGIDPNSNAFLSLLRSLGMGTGGLADRIAGSNQWGDSPVDTSSGRIWLNETQLRDIMAAIATGQADLPHIPDDPADPLR
jgi:hypothetical protein